VGVRYLLHRAFVEQRSWFVPGLWDDGGWKNAAGSPPRAVFAPHADEELVRILEAKLGDGGLSLHETAVLAATLETLVDEESLERLHTAYRSEGLKTFTDGAVSDAEVERAIDAYMAMYLFADDYINTSKAALERMWNRTHTYPGWNATKAWVREVRRDVINKTSEPPTAFSSTKLVVAEILRRYGHWQRRECDAMKKDLIALEKPGTGRVPLQRFYGAALSGQFLFREDKSYLRELGALDEAEPMQPNVLVTNYISTPSNCLAGSRYYHVCCSTGCEELRAPIERAAGAPEAVPEVILRVVERLPPGSDQEPRTLPPTLVERLEGIAAQHGGVVPVHGRLFSQWMHHAFPHECPYPHLSGRVKLQKGSEWERQTGIKHLASKSRMQVYIDQCKAGERKSNASAGPDGVASSNMPWSVDEELGLHPPSQTLLRQLASAGRGLTVVSAAASLAAAVLHASGVHTKALGQASKEVAL